LAIAYLFAFLFSLLKVKNHKNDYYMTSKEQAIQDIKDELDKEGKCFIAFIIKLDPIIEKIVEGYIKQQESNKHE
jgi:hypothetical protein